MSEKPTSEPIQVGELITRIMQKLAEHRKRALDYVDPRKYKDVPPQKESHK